MFKWHAFRLITKTQLKQQCVNTHYALCKSRSVWPRVLHHTINCTSVSILNRNVTSNNVLVVLSRLLSSTDDQFSTRHEVFKLWTMVSHKMHILCTKKRVRSTNTNVFKLISCIVTLILSSWCLFLFSPSLSKTIH